MIYNENAMAAFGRRYRANFINSSGGFKSLVSVGTKNSDESENLAISPEFVHEAHQCSAKYPKGVGLDSCHTTSRIERLPYAKP